MEPIAGKSSCQLFANSTQACGGENNSMITNSTLEMLNSSVVDEVIKSFNSSEPMISEPGYTLIIAAYTVLTTIAVLGNSVVILTVMTRKSIQTTRNIFIFYLAISDLLSAMTIPLTAVDALSRSWQLGNHPLSCKLVKTLPCVAVFMSSLTIVVIAVDRYLVICRPNQTQLNLRTASLMGPIILLLASCSASVLFLKSRLYTLAQLMEKQGFHMPAEYELTDIKYVCIEDWKDGLPLQKEDRLNYTVFSLVIQFLFPLVVIVVVYTKIYFFLKEKNVGLQSQNKRIKRTSTIFFLISVIFCASWLPFCIFCLLSEIVTLFEDTELMLTVYCSCHLVGMSSSCTNPVLYAFFNTNFSREFRNILSNICGLASRKYKVPSLFRSSVQVMPALACSSEENLQSPPRIQTITTVTWTAAGNRVLESHL